MSRQTDNLIPFNQRSPEEHKAISRRGGIASGKSRRKKRKRIEDMKLHDRALKETKAESISLLAESIKVLKEASEYYKNR